MCPPCMRSTHTDGRTGRAGNCGDDISVRFNRPEKLFYITASSAARKIIHVDCSRDARRIGPLVEISPVMPRFNVVIPRPGYNSRACRPNVGLISLLQGPRATRYPARLFCRFADSTARARLIGNFNARYARNALRARWNDGLEIRALTRLRSNRLISNRYRSVLRTRVNALLANAPILAAPSREK